MDASTASLSSVKVNVAALATDDPDGLDVEAQVKGAAHGMTVVFKEVGYLVKNSANKKEQLTLLSNVTSVLFPAEMAALMGPSGSGKTTLLDILAGRKSVGQIKGTMLFNGSKPTSNFLSRHTGYVEQFDTLIGNMTVREMLLYTAEMKTIRTMPMASKVAKVIQVLEQLSLTRCQDVIIGTPLTRGISGGQAKRTNIGLALVSDPRVLFLDEPTSGLDSFTANEVMKVVKGLVQNGITICATIHSPTPSTFRLFDRMMMLLRGQMVYNGPNGPTAVNFFQDTNPDVPRYGSPGVADNMSEWIVDLATQADRDARGPEFAAKYAASSLCADTARHVDFASTNGVSTSQRTIDAISTTRGTTVGMPWAIRTLMKYRWRRDFTDGAYLGPRLADKALMGFIIFGLYWHAAKNPRNDTAENIASVLFIATVLPGFTAAAYMPSIVLERPLFLRERSDGLYHTLTYITAKVAEEMVIAFLGSLIFSNWIWWSTEFRGSYALFLLVHYACTCTGIVLAYFIAALSPNLDVANAALPTYVVTLLFFVGLLIRGSQQPGYWHWYSYINFLKYSWDAHMLNQFKGQNVMFSGQEVLSYFSIHGDKWAFFGYQTIFFAVFFILAWLSMRLVRWSSR
ncbi:hypothetical protein WJX84_007950 [Apatococcus fuscideae]|uniref:ABC transporter domain-containing protein n=1 Tax=Apatococcus fuscideae TaxID=2026836 RepID=A0AAW1T8U6_9CHLO